MIPLHRSVYVLGGVTILAVSAALLVIFVFFKDSGTEEASSAGASKEVISTTESRMEKEEEVLVSTTTIATSTTVETKAIPATKKVEPVKDLPESDDARATQKTITIAPVVKDTSASFSNARMLSAHNVARDQVEVGALSWSNALALGAQKWSAQLQSENCKMRHDPNTPYGENIYWAWSTGESNDALISTPEEAVQMWVGEEAFYNYEKNTCKSGEQCGHYTQVVWEGTTEVGCGVSSCMDSDAQTDIWVCRYNPAGNDGSQPY